MAENTPGQNNTGRENEGNKTSGGLSSTDKDQQTSSANRNGTSDMHNEPLGSSWSDSRSGTGSGITTKQSVSGSDYDGQVSE